MGKRKSKEDKAIEKALKIARFPDGKPAKGNKKRRDKAEKQAKGRLLKKSKPVKKTKNFFKKVWDEVEDIFD